MEIGNFLFLDDVGSEHVYDEDDNEDKGLDVKGLGWHFKYAWYYSRWAENTDEESEKGGKSESRIWYDRILIVIR